MSLPVRPFAHAVTGLPTGPEAAEFDRAAIEDRGVPQVALMEAAGRAAADVVARLYPHGPVLALVGSGNNGGDALVMSRSLAGRGREVSIHLIGDRDPADPLLHGWSIPTTTDRESDVGAACRSAAVVVDGLLGTGLRGAPRERHAAVIRAVNDADRPVVALDLPSGVDSVTGAVAGDAIHAAVTVGFGWPKLGAVLSPGRERAGRVVAVEIGFPPDARFRQAAITPAWAAAHRPARSADTHKNAVGALLLLAGQPGMAGAAVLAGRAAIRAGAGFLRIASPPSNRDVLQATLPEAVFVDSTDLEGLREAAQASRAFAIGPGLGTSDTADQALRTVLAARNGRPAVLDADALNLSAEPGRLARAAESGPILITPHLGEMSRITGHSAETLAADRLESARQLAAACGVTVLMKGFPSVVVEVGGHTMVDTVGTSDLAQAGMGDVLTGAVGSFLAQGADVAPAGALGLYHVGRAATRAGLGAATSPDDVIPRIADALRESGPGDTDLGLPCVTFDHDPPR